MRSSLLLSIAPLMLAVPAALAEEAGNARRGQELAERICSECHGVRGSQELSPRLDVAPFKVIANENGMTERAVIVWLQTSHPRMPNIMLKADEAGDLAAYIMSLKTTLPKSH